jgi:hypothetical protein
VFKSRWGRKRAGPGFLVGGYASLGFRWVLSVERGVLLVMSYLSKVGLLPKEGPRVVEI